VLPGCDADFAPCCFVSEALAGLFLARLSEIMVFMLSGSSFHNSFAGSFTCCVVDFGSCCFVCEEALAGHFLTRVTEIMVFLSSRLRFCNSFPFLFKTFAPAKVMWSCVCELKSSRSSS
jgi:hypothetical protein